MTQPSALRDAAPVFVVEDVLKSVMTKRKPGHGAVNVFVTDVDALYQELKSRGARTLSEPKDYDYGMRDFEVSDLDGNQLSFGMESKK
jgi:uncharacterized glyoxalase superfamily protein PhnB